MAATAARPHDLTQNPLGMPQCPWALGTCRSFRHASSFAMSAAEAMNVRFAGLSASVFEAPPPRSTICTSPSLSALVEPHQRAVRAVVLHRAS
jgi:hypothetical protein